jgi:DNA-binding NarL/FixJ family response regulator
MAPSSVVAMTESSQNSHRCAEVSAEENCQVRILLADDHPIVRRGLRDLIQEQQGWRIVAEASDGMDAVAKVTQLKPDLAILDISMPLLNGLDATKRIARLCPSTKILIVTMHESDQLIRTVLEAGARGYILKEDASRDLIFAVKALLSNNTFFAPKVAETVLAGYLGKGPKVQGNGSPQLSSREREIVQLVAEGKSNKEIGKVWGLSENAVETHRQRIMRKLNCHSAVELVRYAIRNYLAEP